MVRRLGCSLMKSLSDGCPNRRDQSVADGDGSLNKITIVRTSKGLGGA